MQNPPAFKDHFSGHAAAYQRCRPDYPQELFAWLAEQAPATRLAVDVGTGNGQAAIGLARHFDAVVATEPSAGQIRGARPDPRVEYRLEPAEVISVETGSADLVTAAQAAHWLDWKRFVDEASRVLRARGVLAVWCYGDCTVAPEIDRLIGVFSRNVVGPYWPRERRHVEEGYRNLPLTLLPLEAPAFTMRAEWDAASMLGYLDTWSAVRRHRERTGRDPLQVLAAPLAAAWGDDRRLVRWPLSVKAGRA